MSIEKNGIYFVTIVWGSYVNTFVDICLPSLLANNNIPGMQLKKQFIIYTTHGGSEFIRKSISFIILNALIETKIIIIEEPKDHSYSVITYYHEQAFNYIDQFDGGIFIVIPDCVYSNNFCTAIEKHALAGARLISVPNMWVNLEDSTKALLELSQNGILDLSGQELMQIGMKNLHQITTVRVWEQAEGYLLPAVLFWRVDDGGGFVGRSFWGCFTYVHPINKFTKLYATMDSDYIFQACPDQSQYHACINSDEAIVLEMSAKDRFMCGFPKAFIDHLIFYAETLNIYQINHSKHTFRLSTGAASEANWLKAEAQASDIMNSVYDNIKL